MKTLWHLLLYQPLFNLLVLFYQFLGRNMGLAIIGLTVLVRLFLVPSAVKSLIAQKKLNELQPELEKIKKDHGHDKQKLTEATLKLYQEHGVNPFSSCLYSLLQIPILIALYQVFLKINQPIPSGLLYSFVPKPGQIQSHFLWLDLAKPDPFVILPVLAGLMLLWQSKMLQPATPPKTDQNLDEAAQFQQAFSKQMVYLFPLMTFLIALRLPSALALYWVVTTLFGIVQQYIIFKADENLVLQALKKLNRRRKTITQVKERGK